MKRIITAIAVLAVAVLAVVLGVLRQKETAGLLEERLSDIKSGSDLDHDGIPNDLRWHVESFPLRVVFTVGFDETHRRAWDLAVAELEAVVGRDLFHPAEPADPELFVRVDADGRRPPRGIVYLTGGCADKLAMAMLFNRLYDGVIESAKVCFPDNYEDVELAPSVLHEATHLLGIDHDIISGSLMNKELNPQGQLTTATKALLRRLYGPEAPAWGPIP